jgi:hypothetical protein
LVGPYGEVASADFGHRQPVNGSDSAIGVSDPAVVSSWPRASVWACPINRAAIAYVANGWTIDRASIGPAGRGDVWPCVVGYCRIGRRHAGRAVARARAIRDRDDVAFAIRCAAVGRRAAVSDLDAKGAPTAARGNREDENAQGDESCFGHV